MINLYKQFAEATSRKITHLYSTSFTLGIKMLDSKFHSHIYNVYGLVRLADEIVDTFHEQDKKVLLEDFERETFMALERGLSTNPIIHAYQLTANKYKIDAALLRAFFKSMKMDLYQIDYNTDNYNEYIYGSAEVVGLMCLRIFTEGDEKKYQELKEGAKALGAAFQKVNFLRDMQSDFEERGRTYFPGVDFINFTKEQKVLIEQDIHRDFEQARQAILALPESSRTGVYLAYKYYLKLFAKIQKAPASAILKTRFRVPDSEKLYVLASTYFRSFAGWI
ncbi:MAG: phytoene/squalene synthase family protein [Chitinophagales bacterium]|nr:phytoene/squalene synthase family protein [Chitinophagales bacterium]